MSQKPKINIFTDGSCPVPNSCGGWAYIIRSNSEKGMIEKRNSGGVALTTNNRMEMMGVIEALKVLKQISCDLTITSDSQYITKGIMDWMSKWKKNGWKKKNYETNAWEEVANVDLWKEIDELLQKHEYKTNWVRGHAGHPENEWCDQAAGEETDKIRLMEAEASLLNGDCPTFEIIQDSSFSEGVEIAKKFFKKEGIRLNESLVEKLVLKIQTFN